MIVTIVYKVNTYATFSSIDECISYHLYDICMVDIKTFLTRRHEEHVLGKKEML